MKKLLLLGLFSVLGLVAAQAQSGVEVTIRNQQIKGDVYEFDVYLKRTAAGTFYLGYADIVIDSLITNRFGSTPAAVFNSPTFSYVPGSNNFESNSNASLTTAYDGLIQVQNFLGNPGANGDRLIINLDLPGFSDLATLETNVAEINEDDNTWRLGTFQITGLQVNTFAPYFDIHSAGAGIKTKIYEVAGSAPFRQTRVTETTPSSQLASTATDVAEVTVSNQSTTGFTLNWTGGTADRVLVVMRTYDQQNPNLAGEDTTVSDRLLYTANSDFNASVTANNNTASTSRVGNGVHHVVFDGLLSAGTAVITGLTTGQNYKVVVYAYNGELGYDNNFAAGVAIITSSVEEEPLWAITDIYLNTVQANPTTQMLASYRVTMSQPSVTFDAKDSVLFVAFATNTSITANPVDGKFYNASLTYTSGDTIGAGAAYVLGARPVLTGTDTGGFYLGSFEFTGLTANTEYYVRAFPFRANENVYSRNFRTDMASKETNRFTAPETADPSFVASHSQIGTFTSVGMSSLTINFTGAVTAGTGRIIIAKEASAISAEAPVNGYVYPNEGNFAEAPSLTDTTTSGTGTRVVYSGNGTSATITGLDPNQRYYFAAVEYVGVPADRNLNYIADQGSADRWGRADQVTSLAVALQVRLEGAWNGTDMNVGSGYNIAPQNQPYSGANFFSYAGTESYDSLTITNAVDWVLVEVRRVENGEGLADADLGTVFSRQAALLLADGRIVAPDGTDSLEFDITNEGRYFAVVYHRNHIPVMTAAGAPIGQNINRTGAINTIGNLFLASNVAGGTTNAVELVASSGNVFMIAGNADNDDLVVDADDRTAIWAARNQLNDYSLTDVDLDRETGAADRAIAWNNRDKAPYVVITTNP